MRISLILSALFLIIPFTANAHEPVYIGSDTSVSIPDPDTSRAYYGQLNGSPAVFSLSVSTPINFYLNLLSPDISDARTDFTATMTDAEGRVITTLSGGTWDRWYEEFAGDTYLKGPESHTDIPAGTYTITVENPGNSGKYVLAPGEREVFTPAGTPSNVRQIYLMKTQFFNKTPFAIFQGVIGYMLIGTVVIAVALLSLMIYYLRRRRAI